MALHPTPRVLLVLPERTLRTLLNLVVRWMLSKHKTSEPLCVATFVWESCRRTLTVWIPNRPPVSTRKRNNLKFCVTKVALPTGAPREGGRRKLIHFTGTRGPTLLYTFLAFSVVSDSGMICHVDSTCGQRPSCVRRSLLCFLSFWTVRKDSSRTHESY